MMPLVSILMPAYNASPYVAAAIESVLAQTHSIVEVIVVDDGSFDDTLHVARKFEGRQVCVLSQVNRGASAARNRAFDECQGEFIQYLDADDLLHPNKVRTQLARLHECSQATIAAGRWGRFSASPHAARFVPEPFWKDCDPVEWLSECWVRHSMLQPGAWLLPRRLVEAAGPWDESLTLNDDGEFFARAVLASDGVAFCDGAVLYYRSGMPGALSNRKTNAAWDSAFRSLKKCSPLLLAVEQSPRTRRACCRAFEEFVYGSYPAVPQLRAEAWQHVRELGGPYFRPQMGPRMRAMSRLMGWKGAKWLRRALESLGQR